MIRLVFSFFLFFIVSISFGQSDDYIKFRNDYLKEFNPQGYNAVQTKDALVNQGKSIARGLSQQLDSYSTLIKTNDPAALLNDFNNKMANIQSLEQSLIDQSYSMANSAGKQIGNAINSGDGLSALGGAIGFLEANAEMKRAEQELQRKKAALEEQQRSQMSTIYWKAKAFNDNTKSSYLELAAYAEKEEDELYYLALAENLDCFSTRMRANFSISNTSWLNNNCPQPQKPTSSAIANNFISRDRQLMQVAERKFKIYQERQLSEFLTGAISFMAAAANEKPSAEYFYKMGKYQADQSTVLSLSSLLTARAMSPGYFGSDEKAYLEQIRNRAQGEISSAIRTNNKEYIQSFLASGLDRTVQVNGAGIYNFAIQLDQPDAVQLILNKRIEGLAQSKKDQMLKQAIMLAAANDSDMVINRFIELGVPIDFTLNNTHPIDVAVKSLSLDALEVLMKNSNKRGTMESKHGSSLAFLVHGIQENPTAAGSKYDQLSSANQKFLINYLFPVVAGIEQPVDLRNQYLDFIISNNNATTYCRESFSSELKNLLVESTSFGANDGNIAAKLIRSGLVKLDRVPLISELSGKDEESKRSPTYQEKMEILGDAIFSGDNEFAQIKEKSVLATSEKEYIDYYLYMFPKFGKDYDLTKRLTKNPVVEKISNEKKRQRLLKFYQDVTNGLSNYPNLKEGLMGSMALHVNPYTSEAAGDGYTLYYYAVAAVRGYELDAKSIEALKLRGVEIGGNSNPSLALQAIKNKNGVLFKVLDEKFDLSQIKESDGRMLTDHLKENPTLLSSDFMSDDFKEKVTIDIELVKDQFVGDLKKGNAWPLLNFVKTSDPKYQLKFTDEGGSILHWIIDLASQGELEWVWYKIDLSYLKNAGFPLNLEDDNGDTALEYFYDKEDQLRDWSIKHYDGWNKKVWKLSASNDIVKSLTE